MTAARLASAVRKTLALAVVLTVIGSASTAEAGWSWRSWYFRGGSGCGGGSSAVPEIDAGSAGAALTLLMGGVLMLRDRYSIRREQNK